ncbi:MAG: hypothetical protein ACLFTX_04510, partial [Thiohalospira sp.]
MQRLLEAVVLPPGSGLALLLVAALLRRSRWRRLGLPAAIAGALLIYLPATPWVAAGLMQAAQGPEPSADAAPAGAILLPGAGRSVPGAAVTIRDLIIATGTVAVVVWLARAVPAVSALVRGSLVGSDRLVEDAGRIAAALVVFLAVLIAYRGLAGVAIPTLVARDSVWAYDLAFLTVALVPLAVIANRIRRNLDEVADLVTGAVVETDDRPVGEPSES